MTEQLTLHFRGEGLTSTTQVCLCYGIGRVYGKTEKEMAFSRYVLT